MSSSFHEEEQEMEKEALEAILMDDLEVISSTVPREYSVKIVPHAHGEGDNHVGVRVTFKIPPTYPDIAADISIKVEKGLSEGQSEELRQYTNSKAEENVGMAMVYTLTDTIREWLSEHNIAGQDGSMHAEMLKRMHMNEKQKKKDEDHAAAAAMRSALRGATEEDEMMRQKRLEGTPVNPESFKEWRDRFEEEMSLLAGSKGVQKEKGPKKPSGKEMFYGHMAGTEGGEADEEDADDAAVAVEVDHALFGGGEDDDEDDSDFELDDDEEEDDDDDDEESDG